MRIDPLQAGTSFDLPAAAGKGNEKARQSGPNVPLDHVVQDQPTQIEPANVKQQTVAAALPEPARVTVSVDASREFVYRFVDAKTGDVISQTPPEQVLEVVRGIQDLLRAEERAKSAGVNVRG